MEFLVRPSDTIHHNRPFMFIVWQGIAALCILWHVWISKKLWNKSNFVMQTLVTNFFEVVVAVGGLLVFLFIIYMDAITKPNERYMKNPIGTVSTLQQTTTHASLRTSLTDYLKSHDSMTITMSTWCVPILFL